MSDLKATAEQLAREIYKFDTPCAFDSGIGKSDKCSSCGKAVEAIKAALVAAVDAQRAEDAAIARSFAEVRLGRSYDKLIPPLYEEVAEAIEAGRQTK